MIVHLLGLGDEALQVGDVGRDDGRDVVKLAELVAVVLGKHALGADDLVAQLAEVLNLLVLVVLAEDLLLSQTP